MTGKKDDEKPGNEAWRLFPIAQDGSSFDPTNPHAHDLEIDAGQGGAASRGLAEHDPLETRANRVDTHARPTDPDLFEGTRGEKRPAIDPEVIRKSKDKGPRRVS